MSDSSDPFWWAGPTLRKELANDPAAVLASRGITPPADMPVPILHEFIRTTCLLWVNGELTPFDEFHIDPADEGLLFGRGCWESTRTIGGVPWLWNWHTDRMLRTAELLNIPLSAEQLPNVEQVKEFVHTLGSQDVVIRLNATAGRPGFRGTVWMSAAPQPVPTQFLRLKSMVNPVQKGQAYLALKTFQYATRLRINQQAREAGYDTALVIDTNGNIEEAAHANIFMKFAEGWATPSADGGLLPGTVRQLLLQQSPIKMRDEVIPFSKLNEVQEVFATNSNIGIVPIVQIDDKTFPIGDDTRNLMKWILPPEPAGTQYRFQETNATPR